MPNEQNKTLVDFIKLYENNLIDFSEKIIHDRFAAENIVWDTFIKLHKRIDKFSAEEHVRNWLYRTVKRACLNYIRNRKVEKSNKQDYQYLLNESTNEILEDSNEDMMLKSEELRSEVRLPPQMQKICDMIFKEGLSPKEIARKLNKSASTIRVTKANIVKKYKKKFREKRLLGLLIILFGAFSPITLTDNLSPCPILLFYEKLS